MNIILLFCLVTLGSVTASPVNELASSETQVLQEFVASDMESKENGEQSTGQIALNIGSDDAEEEEPFSRDGVRVKRFFLPNLLDMLLPWPRAPVPPLPSVPAPPFPRAPIPPFPRVPGSYYSK